MSNPSENDRDEPVELTEEAVGQSDRQKDATGQQGQRSGRQQSGGQRPDPNREPGGQGLDNEDTEGNVFYDKNTEIKRESEFHDSTAAPIGNPEKVTQKDDQFGKQPKK